MHERHREHAAVDEHRRGDDLRPPHDEALGLHPIGLIAPLLLEDEDEVAAVSQRFAFGPVVLVKTVARNDAPAPGLRYLGDPVHVLRVALEIVKEMHHGIDIVFSFGKDLHATSQERRQVRVEEEFQARSRSSNRTAAITCLGSISNWRATRL